MSRPEIISPSRAERKYDLFSRTKQNNYANLGLNLGLCFLTPGISLIHLLPAGMMCTGSSGALIGSLSCGLLVVLGINRPA